MFSVKMSNHSLSGYMIIETLWALYRSLYLTLENAIGIKSWPQLAFKLVTCIEDCLVCKAG